MASNIVTISGMFGNGKTYFADSPVVIDISGLEWPDTSPFNVVRVRIVKYDDNPAATQLEDTKGYAYKASSLCLRVFVSSCSIYKVEHSTS